MEIGRRRKYFDQANLERYVGLLESTTKLLRGLGRAKKLLLVKTTAQPAGVLIVTVYLLSSVLL